MGVSIIAMVGSLRSHLGKESDIVLDISVKEEACPHDLAPTASTTATLAMGDALAVALLAKRNFTKEEFAMFHPGGNLGKQLLLKVEEIMVSGKEVPVVRESATLSEAIYSMTSGRLGATCVINDQGVLTGIITDGDLRRLLGRMTNVTNVLAADVMTKNPKAIRKGLLAVAALEEMERYSISQLIVVEEHHKPVGMIHIHDLVKAGLRNETSA
jgi:arabinose-5-phosphate isomerase